MNTERPLDTAALGHQTADWKEHVRHQHSGRWQGPLGRMQVQIIQQAAPHFLSQAEDAPCTRQDSIPQPVKSRRFSLTSLINGIMQLFQRSKSNRAIAATDLLPERQDSSLPRQNTVETTSSPEAATDMPPPYATRDPRGTAAAALPPPYTYKDPADTNRLQTGTQAHALQTTTASTRFSWATLTNWLFMRTATNQPPMGPPPYAVTDPLQLPRSQINPPPYSEQNPWQEPAQKGDVPTTPSTGVSPQSSKELRQNKQKAFDILDRGSQFKLQLLVHTQTLEGAQQAFLAQNSAAGQELMRKARQQFDELDRHRYTVEQVAREARLLHGRLTENLQRNEQPPLWLDALQTFSTKTNRHLTALAGYRRDIQRAAGRFSPAPNSVMFKAALKLAEELRPHPHSHPIRTSSASRTADRPEKSPPPAGWPVTGATDRTDPQQE